MQRIAAGLASFMSVDAKTCKDKPPLRGFSQGWLQCYTVPTYWMSVLGIDIKTLHHNARFGKCCRNAPVTLCHELAYCLPKNLLTEEETSFLSQRRNGNAANTGLRQSCLRRALICLNQQRFSSWYRLFGTARHWYQFVRQSAMTCNIHTTVLSEL
jgi:hypothetical protein